MFGRIKWDRYIPTGSTAREFPDVNAVVYVYDYPSKNGRQHYSACAYCGKRTKADFHTYFMSDEERERNITSWVDGLRQRKAYKEEQRAKAKEMGVKGLSEAAQCAHAVRSVLAMAYPDTKFIVRSSNFTGGSDVNVYYTDGPSSKAVEHLLAQYEKGHFDGMTDMYEYDNTHDNQPQVKYLFINRTMSDAVRESIKQNLGLSDEDTFLGDSRIYREFCQMNL